MFRYQRQRASDHFRKRRCLGFSHYKGKINHQFYEWSKQHNSFDIKSNYISYHDNSNKEFKEVLITNYEPEIVIPTQKTINFKEFETVE